MKLPLNEASRKQLVNHVQKHYYHVIKAVFDYILLIIASIPALILILVFAIIVKLDSAGPAFYSQKRVGKNGKVFTIYKLRSMIQNAETKGSVWAAKDDPRITRVGKFIRKTRIDELPQLLNVLKGEMSWIGPRPERDDLTKQFCQEIPDFDLRLLVKPGLTGLAQVHGGYEITPAEKLEYDLEYLSHFGLRQDIQILFKTIKVVITGDGAR